MFSDLDFAFVLLFLNAVFSHADEPDDVAMMFSPI
jgi:hypothetical protein